MFSAWSTDPLYDVRTGDPVGSAARDDLEADGGGDTGFIGEGNQYVFNTIFCCELVPNNNTWQ